MSDKSTDDLAPAGGLADRVTGKAKRVAGSVLGDEQLRQEGELHEAKADRANDARRLAANAAGQQTEAELSAREQELAAERRRLAAEEAADRREEHIERDRTEAERRLDESLDRRQSAVEHAARAEEQVIDSDDFRAATKRAGEEREAQQIEQEAERARQAAARLDRMQKEADA